MTTASTITLPVLPLPDGVVLPDMVVTVAAQSSEAKTATAASADGRLLLVPKIDGRFTSVGVEAVIEDQGELPDGTPALTIRAKRRMLIGSGVIGETAALFVEVSEVPEHETDDFTDELASEYRAVANEVLTKVGGRRMAGALREITDPSNLADSVAYWPELSRERRIELLETISISERLRLGTAWLKEALAELNLREQIQREVSDDLEKNQREAILRRQMAAIQTELGEGDTDVINGYRRSLEAAEAHMPEATVSAVNKEIDRLERSGTESQESSWIRTWLDTVFELPWAESSPDDYDLAGARTVLDADHTGLEEPKDRIVEYLAVRKLRADRGLSEAEVGRRRGGLILALVGPPGVGKTSLGESIAEALGRKFVRLALGGIRDEAEIRGHRRTYVGARPGRVVRALTEAGSMNPVVLLDEVDKVGADWRGDPSAALLEVLDPAQNHSFRDHYLEFELDLSDVVFVATANVLDTIPGPLLDRMEIINLDGYTEAEKATIARDHLLGRVLSRTGLSPEEVTVTDDAIGVITADYTREAGVRRLERLLDKAVRKAATKIATEEVEPPIIIDTGDLNDLIGRPIPHEDITGRLDRPGVAAGLAVTGAGGDVLLVETALIDGEGEPLLTGQLGDVMKESATIARSVAASLATQSWPSGKRLHVHFPSGAVPKDGPSAGITMVTALLSLLSDRPVRSDLGMTGEISLGGRVLPIGGVKQKVLAAHRNGLRTVVLPAANEPDAADIPKEVRDQMDLHFVSEIGEVIDLALAA